MSDYRRARIPGGTYFFTLVTYARRHFLTDPRCQTILADVIREVQLVHPFAVNAWVYLPEHWHCIWTLPVGDTDYSKRWGLIKVKFSRQAKLFLQEEGLCEEAAFPHGPVAIWQKRFWEHVIRDDIDFRKHLDYIHYNPVKHGYVERVESWPYSSFHDYVAQGMYDDDWGVDESMADSQAFGE